MDTPALSYLESIPAMGDGPSATMLLAFSGWMDGGDVSTGTVRRFIELLEARPFATIDGDRFYLLNFPGGMEVTALFRPHIRIENGLVRSYEEPTNVFFAAPDHRLVLFVGKEPNLRWRQFGDAVFAVARRAGVSRIVFVGSFGGAVPHTREPRLYCTASNEKLVAEFEPFGFKPSNYEGPGAFTTYLITRAADEGLDMASLVAEIPGYLQGTNPVSIEAVTRRLRAMLNLKVDLDSLRGVSTEWELKVSEVVAKDDDLARHIRELEEKYDDELIQQGGDA